MKAFSRFGWVAAGLGALVWGMAGCGSDKPPFASSTMTVVIGGGEKADEPQDTVVGIERVEVAGEQVCGAIQCTAVNGRWLLKETVTLVREVKGGSKGKLTLIGKEGTATLDLTFSDSLIPRKKKHELWGTTLEVQCYASVGNKWGLLVFVQPR